MGCFHFPEEVKAKHPNITYADLYQVIIYGLFVRVLFVDCFSFYCLFLLVTSTYLIES